MNIRLPLRNVFRQRRRTLMTLSSIVFGVSVLILSGGFVQDIFVQLGEAIVHSQTGHLQVFKRGFQEGGKREPGRYLIDNAPDLMAQIARLPQTNEVAARLGFSGLLNNGRRDLSVVGEGVQPAKEEKLGSHIRITAGRPLRDSDKYGLLVGAGLANSLGLVPGQNVTLVANTFDGALNTLDLEIVGLFESFSKDFDARAVRINLLAAQELLAVEKVNVIVVGLNRTEDTAVAQKEIQSRSPGDLQVLNWRELSDFYEKTVQLYDSQFGVLQFIILIMVLLSVANSVNMSLFERQGEFGTMRAIGNKGSDIRNMIIVECLFLGLIGATIGLLAGVCLAVLISAIGIPMPPPPNANLGYTAYIRLVPSVLIASFAVGVLATVLASIIPAHKVSRIDIVDALRQNV